MNSNRRGSVEKVKKLKTILRDPVSLETPVGRDG